MIKYRIWLISLLVILIGFASIGFFKPTDTIRSTFQVGRSASTTFRVLTKPTNLNQFFDHPVTVEPIESHQNRIGDRLNVERATGNDTTGVEIEIVEFVDIERFTFQFSRPESSTRATYSLLRNEKGTDVQITQVITPNNWWRRSLLPIIKGSLLEQQDRVNEQLARLIESSPESLIGDWLAINGDGSDQMFTFNSDGTLDWSVTMGEDVFPLKGIHYVRQSSVHPELLDLSGFTTGPLRGLTLFGILDMSRRDTLMFDAAAGLPDDDRVRPEAFTASAMTYVRIR